MDQNSNTILNMLSDVKESMAALNEKLERVEKRLDQLGKVDSIEHRVTSNQIDITDIKDALERMEELQVARVERIATEILEASAKQNEAGVASVQKRLDTHLLKIGRVEEDILILQGDK